PCVAGGERNLLQEGRVLKHGSPGRPAMVPFCQSPCTHAYTAAWPRFGMQIHRR
ncbi:hypothetical protein KUCAC02_004321, partial [Chaenocephalus aceratus]